MRAILVDDERLARKELRRLLLKHPHVEVVGEAANADNARLLLSELQPDLVFLDVQMPGESGFDFLMKLDSFPAVIFTTAFDQFALKAFEFGAYDYLLKPVEPARLAASLVRIGDRESVRLPSSGSVDEVLRESDQVFVRDGENCWMVQLADIQLFESEGNYTRIHFKGERALVARSPNALEIRLDPKVFFRANRSQIINLRWVQSIRPWFSRGLRIKLRSGSEVEISRRRSQQFRDFASL
jgi:two-component system LytT family response regulator